MICIGFFNYRIPKNSSACESDDGFARHLEYLCAYRQLLGIDKHSDVVLYFT